MTGTTLLSSQFADHFEMLKSFRASGIRPTLLIFTADDFEYNIRLALAGEVAKVRFFTFRGEPASRFFTRSMICSLQR
jgi:hypothetical protein